jgi:hypothetical protein
MTSQQDDKVFSLHKKVNEEYLTSELWTTRKAADNSRFAKAGVSCFYDSEVLNSSIVHPMKFSAKNPRLRKAAKRQAVKKA